MKNRENDPILDQYLPICCIHCLVGARRFTFNAFVNLRRLCVTQIINAILLVFPLVDGVGTGSDLEQGLLEANCRSFRP